MSKVVLDGAWMRVARLPIVLTILVIHQELARLLRVSVCTTWLRVLVKTVVEGELNRGTRRCARLHALNGLVMISTELCVNQTLFMLEFHSHRSPVVGQELAAPHAKR